MSRIISDPHLSLFCKLHISEGIPHHDYLVPVISVLSTLSIALCETETQNSLKSSKVSSLSKIITFVFIKIVFFSVYKHE